MQLCLLFSFSMMALICSTFAFTRVQPLQNGQPIDVNLRDKSAQIISYSNEFNPEDNSYVFQFETDNGIKTEGFAKDNTVSMKGSYFMPLQDGSQVPVQFTADENGFQVDSPAIPTPHPSIVKLIQHLRTLPPLREEEEQRKKGGIDV